MFIPSFFKKLFEEGFNVVIEGTYCENWKQLHYKPASLNVPEGMGVLTDGTCEYILYGITDFKEIKKADIGTEALQVQNVVLRQGASGIIETLRTVCMMDGRVYVERDMLKDGEYLEALNSMVKKFREMFGDKELHRSYKKAVKSGKYPALV